MNEIATVVPLQIIACRAEEFTAAFVICCVSISDSLRGIHGNNKVIAVSAHIILLAEQCLITSGMRVRDLHIAFNLIAPCRRITRMNALLEGRLDVSEAYIIIRQFHIRSG